MRISTLFVIVLLMLTPDSARAGQGTTTGKEWQRWSTGRYCVVVANIRGVRKTEGEGYRPYQATLFPLASLAGSLDPSVHRELPVTFYVSDMTSSIRKSVPLPKDDATVLAVVRMPDPERGPKEQQGFIVSDICTFMPGESALVTLDGLADPRVRETLKKLQVARANPDPSPYPRATTRPAGTPPKQRVK